MTEDQTDDLLADCLEEYHREKARGEVPDEVRYRERLGDLHGEFMALVGAETLIDAALEPAGDDTALPMAWGSYTLLREIARGAAGVVYEAMHRKLGRKVALKVLRTGVDTDSSARERFQREAQALAHIKHDHIVEIYEFGEVDGRPFYAMSLVNGPTLADIAKQGPEHLPDPRDLCRGLAGVASALRTLHGAGIIHRDVKPSNIMVDESGRYMLADFGLARSAMSATMTRSGDALGTPLYMSPEQMLGNRSAVEERSDVYGLGATMYQLLTGVPPFKTDNLHALMRMILKERPAHPRTVRSELLSGCSNIAMKCLEKEPGDRYASAEALEHDLLAFADGQRITGRVPNPGIRALRHVRRHPALAVAALALLAVGAWFAFLKAPEPARCFISTYPAMARAVVSFDHGDFKPLPIENHPLKPGVEHFVVIKGLDEGFGRRSFPIAPLEPGQRYDLVERLGEAVTSGDAPAVLKAYGQEVALPSEPSHQGSTERSGDTAIVELMAPRGIVRAPAAGTWEVHITEAWPDDAASGRLRFFRGEEELASAEFPPPDEYVSTGRLPATAIAKLKSGDKVTWFFEDAEGKRHSAASFTFSTVDLRASLAAIENRTEDVQASVRERLRTNLRASLYLQHGLAQAAYREILPLTVDLESEMVNPYPLREDATQLQVSLMQAALEKLYPSSEERLASSTWFHMAHVYRAKWDEKAWAAFYKERGVMKVEPKESDDK